MNDFWHTFEDNFGENITSPPPQSSFVIPLSQLSIVEIKGEDSNDFLQNLLSNDVNQLDINQAQLTAFCNPKGRIIILFWLIKVQNNHFFALMPEDTAVIFQKRLSMFILRSKVTIEDVSNEYIAIALDGHTQTLDLISNSTPLKCQFAILKQDKATDEFKKLQAEEYQLCDSITWETLLVNAGIPSVKAASSETFTPQQINLDLVGGVSFQKGCYPGQEVVARLHYLGSPSRRLFIAKYQGKTPEVNSLITNELDSTVGHVVSASRDEAQLTLVSLKLSEINQNLYLNSKTLTIVKALA
jgi:hypothetical protein